MVFKIGLIDRQMDFYGVNVQHGVDLFARSVRSSWLVVVTCSFVIIRLNVLGTLRLLVSTSSGSPLVLKPLMSFLHQWLQIQIRVSAKTQPNDMSFGLTPFISMSVLFVPGFIFGVTG